MGKKAPFSFPGHPGPFGTNAVFLNMNPFGLGSYRIIPSKAIIVVYNWFSCSTAFCNNYTKGRNGSIFQSRNILNILRVDSVDTTFHAIVQNQWTTTERRLSSIFVMMPLVVPFNNHRGSGNRIRLIDLILLNHNLCSMILKELL